MKAEGHSRGAKHASKSASQPSTSARSKHKSPHAASASKSAPSVLKSHSSKAQSKKVKFSGQDGEASSQEEHDEPSAREAPVEPSPASGDPAEPPSSPPPASAVVAPAEEPWRPDKSAPPVDPDDEYVLNFLTGMVPFIVFAVALMRHPFSWRQTGPERYEIYWGKHRARLYWLTSGVIFFACIWFSFSLACLFLNLPRPTRRSHQEHLYGAKGIPGAKGAPDFTSGWATRAEEMFMFSRHVCSVMMYWAMTLHLGITIWKAYWNRDTQIHFLTYLTNSMASMKVHSGDGLRAWMNTVMFLYLFFMFLFVFAAATNVIPFTSGAPATIAMISCRVIWPEIHTIGVGFSVIKWFTQLWVLYMMFCSKIYVLFYAILCRTICQSFQNWNQRLDIVLNRADNFLVHGARFGKRTSFRQLFEDHTVLLDLIEGHDEYYQDTIESFYMSMIISICFEYYYLYRCVTGPEFVEARRFDGFMVGAYCIHSMGFMVFVLLTSASVADSSVDGLEAVRRKGIFGRKSPDEIYFLMSLYVSYGGHFQTALSGAGFFTHDKTFLTTLFGTILSYFIILIQFQTPLEYPDPLMKSLVDKNSLLRWVEDTRDVFVGFDAGYLSYAAPNATTLSFDYLAADNGSVLDYLY